MTPWGLARLHQLSQFLPRDIVAWESVVLFQAVKPNTLSNYGAGLLRFTQFCDHFNIKEALRMPAPEWLLSHFITTRGAGSISSGSLRTWLLGLELWHTVNCMPWNGARHLKLEKQGAGSQAPLAACCPKCSPVTLAHLRALRANLNLNDTCDAAVFVTATISFWCQCRLSEVCVDNPFDPIINPAWSTPQKSGKTASNIAFHTFWAPQTKTKPNGEFIMWTDSQCSCSSESGLSNHLKINCHVPPSAHLFTFETESGSYAPMKRHWFVSRCNKIWSNSGLEMLTGHYF